MFAESLVVRTLWGASAPSHFGHHSGASSGLASTSKCFGFRLCSMIETVMSRPLRRLAPVLLVLAATAVPVGAQQPPPPPGYPGAPQRNPICVRLEGQLQMVDRGSTDPARADQ